ncbi:PLP-dependent aminotransferase family protein [Salipiger sp. PrR002]|uniref:aminotransferase-like domain-containing protein n=1 Tax=Salipiger sp. PrR002 TaxID=2706489 RepID=UPI0013BBAD02|nr:PLP-dependent aminotransferase family protein [Salipiger sp. PrR002]NDW01903.1 PLP-dependent aminotransferase family protein [Salipiger sp. PrR002]NDW59067.1 PLP-dependent aminotransferase family protein [Salipiger sp. PrR004]
MTGEEIAGRYVVLDHGADVPLYIQVSRGLLRAIQDGHFRNGKLPATRQLAQFLNLGINTISLSYQELESQGVIYSAQRSGWFVNEEFSDLHVDQDAEPVQTAGAQWQHKLFGTHTPGDPPEVRRSTNDATVSYPFITASLPRESFPVSTWIRAARDAFEGPSRAFSVYDNFGADDPFLVEMILKELLPARGIFVGPENILLTAGTQHALHMIAQVTMRPGTQVAFEDPGYPDARHSFLRSGAELFPVPIDKGGLMLDEIPDAAEIIYTTPSHQLPSNVSMSTPRKVRLHQMAAATGKVIIEDDYDSEMRFVGQSSAPIAANGLSNVIYVSGFSKYLGAICRIAFVVAHADVIAAIRGCRRYQIRNLSGHEQRTLAHFISSGGYERQIRSLRRIAKRRWQSCNRLVSKHLPGWQMPPSSGGLNLWIKAPGDLDTTELAARLRRRRVAIEPGRVFFHDPERGRSFIKLGFLLMDEERQEAGLKILAQTAAELAAE